MDSKDERNWGASVSDRMTGVDNKVARRVEVAASKVGFHLVNNRLTALNAHQRMIRCTAVPDNRVWTADGSELEELSLVKANTGWGHVSKVEHVGVKHERNEHGPAATVKVAFVMGSVEPLGAGKECCVEFVSIEGDTSKANVAVAFGEHGEASIPAGSGIVEGKEHRADTGAFALSACLRRVSHVTVD